MRIIGDSLRYSASNKEIGLVVLPPHRSGPTCIMSDHQVLYQVLLNLVGNAIKFTATGMVTLDCRVEVTNSAEGRCDVSFEIRDTGMGMDPAFVAQLNRGDALRFNQSTAGKTFGGSGLGLYIVQGDIVQENACTGLRLTLTFRARVALGFAARI